MTDLLIMLGKRCFLPVNLIFCIRPFVCQDKFSLSHDLFRISN
jgi:hypothetical protein